MEVAFIPTKATDLTWDNNEEKLLHQNSHKVWVSAKDKKKSELITGKMISTTSTVVAQGSAIYPILATVLLTQLLMLKYPDVEIVMYADDGLLTSDHPFNPYEILGSICKRSGIKAHLEAPKLFFLSKMGENSWCMAM